VTLCPNRNPLSGNCLPNTTALPNTFYAANGTFLRFQAPGALSVADQSLLVERICVNDVVGNCGLPVWVYVHSCVLSQAPGPSTCGAADAFASPLLYDAAVRVFHPLAAVHFPSCYGAGAPGPDDCQYSVGVFADCSQLPAGADCTDALVRVTWAGDTSPQTLPPDCTGDQRFCFLPAVDIGAAAAGVRRYSSYVSQKILPPPPQPALASVNIVVSACTGALNGYLCTNNFQSKCVRADQPSASNNDMSGGSAGRIGNSGIFTLNYIPTALTAFEKPFFWGVWEEERFDLAGDAAGAPAPFPASAPHKPPPLPHPRSRPRRPVCRRRQRRRRHQPHLLHVSLGVGRAADQPAAGEGHQHPHPAGLRHRAVEPGDVGRVVADQGAGKCRVHHLHLAVGQPRARLQPRVAVRHRRLQRRDARRHLLGRRRRAKDDFGAGPRGNVHRGH
jgi:hypothetical protein